MPKTKTKSETANIYAVVGSGEAEVKHAAAELAQKLLPDDAGDFIACASEIDKIHCAGERTRLACWFRRRAETVFP